MAKVNEAMAENLLRKVAYFNKLSEKRWIQKEPVMELTMKQMILRHDVDRLRRIDTFNNNQRMDSFNNSV